MKTTRIFLLVLVFTLLAFSCKKPDLYQTFQKLQKVNSNYLYVSDSLNHKHTIMRLKIMADSLKNAGDDSAYVIINRQLDLFHSKSMVTVVDSLPHPWPCPGGHLCTKNVENVLIPGQNPKMYKNNTEIKLKPFNEFKNVGLKDYKLVKPVKFSEKDILKVTYEIRNKENEIVPIDIH